MGKHREFSTYYDLLEVSQSARLEVLHGAYRELMKIYHPRSSDGTDGKKAQELNAAYAVLSDPIKRAEYDRSLQVRRKNKEFIGGYKLLDQIAEGAFGRTFRGMHRETEEIVCIKDCFGVHPEFYPILVQEAKNMWDLRHYAIPAIRDLIKCEDGSYALIMSYIPGLTLEQMIKKVGQLDAETVAWISERILNVLMYIHYENVIHGDLKPQNIIIQHDKHMVALVDFGLSLSKRHAETDSKGYTPVFAPPEEIAGLPLLPQSDFYSLGMTMIYALTGNIEHTRTKKVPQTTPDPLCDFINRLIVRDIMSRPHWSTINLFEEIQKVRMQSFGRTRSGMKPIAGL